MTLHKLRQPRPVGADLVRNAPDAGPWPTTTTAKAKAQELTELRELALDLISFSLDLAGTVDPTPTCDATSAFLALSRGRWLDAAISGVGILPYIGDLAKAGKLPRYLRSIERSIDMAERTGQAARLLPGIRQIEKALTWFPVGGNKILDQIRAQCAAFTRRHGKRSVRIAERDVSRSFRFTHNENGDYLRSTVTGRLGIPGRVKRHRASGDQRKFKNKYGGQAGHLIGDQFGATGQAENLVIQTWFTNHKRFAPLERQWRRLLQSGEGIYVRIVVEAPRGSNLVEYISIRWERIDLKGNIHREWPLTFRNLDY